MVGQLVTKNEALMVLVLLARATATTKSQAPRSEPSSSIIHNPVSTFKHGHPAHLATSLGEHKQPQLVSAQA